MYYSRGIYWSEVFITSEAFIGEVFIAVRYLLE